MPSLAPSPAAQPPVPAQWAAATRSRRSRGTVRPSSLNAEAIRAVQPGVDAGALQANFSAVTAYNVKMQVQAIAFDSPSAARASCLMTYSPVPKPSGKIPPVATIFHLRRSGEVWLIERSSGSVGPPAPTDWPRPLRTRSRGRSPE
jgi:hypothetical protein